MRYLIVVALAVMLSLPVAASMKPRMGYFYGATSTACLTQAM